MALALPLLLALTACQNASPLPRMDLAEPGWSVHQGQAVWHPHRQAPEIAGDIMVATHPHGRAFVQFSKSPITLAVAWKSADAWQIEFPVENKHYAGRGRPPARLIWLVFSSALSGPPPPEPWKLQQLKNGHWRLENARTGESLEGYFTS